MGKNSGIGVVIVTFNRLEKLKIALECFDQQVTLPMYVIVIDNASTDGTKEFLDKWNQQSGKFEKIVVRLPYNTGGSGGFCKGLEVAQDLDADWIWVSDDDAYPETDALKRILEYVDRNPQSIDACSAICSMVMDHDKISYVHRRNISEQGGKLVQVLSCAEDYKQNFFEINAFSYVGIAINRCKLRKVGLPRKEFFIFFDDTEHSLRLSKAGKIICLPSVIVHHDQGIEKNDGLSWRDYYSCRNNLCLVKEHFSKGLFDSMIKHMKSTFFWKKITFNFGEKYKMREAAMNDAIEGKLGIHPVYRPGWKPSK